MQQGRISTIRFNEWICVCAQYEKTIARIGRQVYQGYTRGLLTDYAAIELCKEISQAFTDSKQIRSDLEEELERDALHGLSEEESKKAEEVMELTSSQKMVRKVKLRLTKLMGRAAVNRSLQGYRDKVREQSRELGLRAVAVYDKEPLLKIDGHKRLVQLAKKLDEDSNKKWGEITASKTDKGGGLNISFHTMLISFIGSFANFSRGTAFGKMVLKMMKYDPKEEEAKLTKQFEGSKSGDVLAKTLEAQMAEVEEPDLDIGREMATMEREYKETPAEWGLPSQKAEAWVPDTSDTWAPDVVEEPKAPAAPVAQKTSSAAPPAAEGPRPQVLRQRKPEGIKGAEAWVAGDKSLEPESWAAPPPAPPPAAAPRLQSQPAEDWASEEPEPFEPSPSAPRIGGGPPQLARPGAPARPPGPVSPPPLPGTPDIPSAGGNPGRGPVAGARPGAPQVQRPAKPAALGHPPGGPPAQRPPKPAALGHPAPQAPPQPQPRPAGPPPSRPQAPVAPPVQAWAPQPPAPASSSPPPLTGRPSPAAPPGQPPLPPLPPMPSRALRSPEDGHSSPAPPVAPPRPLTPPAPMRPVAPSAAQESDPLLKLVRNDPGELKSDDDLLPAFLRNRSDEDSQEPSSFIPDLPDSVDSGLKILPFGAMPKKEQDDEPGTFIPRMPD